MMGRYAKLLLALIVSINVYLGTDNLNLSAAACVALLFFVVE
jgi:hypothetical protein